MDKNIFANATTTSADFLHEHLNYNVNNFWKSTLEGTVYHGKKLYGYNIATNINILDREKRTWKERLFTLPWCPWKKYKNVPSESIIKIGGTFFMHPEKLKEIELSIKEGYKNECNR